VQRIFDRVQGTRPTRSQGQDSAQINSLLAEIGKGWVYLCGQLTAIKRDRSVYCRQIDATAGHQPIFLIGKLVCTKKKRPERRVFIRWLAGQQLLHHKLPEVLQSQVFAFGLREGY